MTVSAVILVAYLNLFLKSRYSNRSAIHCVDDIRYYNAAYYFFNARLVSAYLNKVVPGVVKHMGTTFVEFIDLMLRETELKGCNKFNCDVNKHWSPMNFR